MLEMVNDGDKEVVTEMVKQVLVFGMMVKKTHLSDGDLVCLSDSVNGPFWRWCRSVIWCHMYSERKQLSLGRGHVKGASRMTSPA